MDVTLRAVLAGPAQRGLTAPQSLRRLQVSGACAPPLLSPVLQHGWARALPHHHYVIGLRIMCLSTVREAQTDDALSHKKCS